MEDQNGISQTNVSQANGLRQCEQRLAMVLEHHSKLSESLQRASASYLGSLRQQTIALSQFFAEGPDASCVLKRPDALSICIPLLSETSKSLDKWHIDDAVGEGMTSISQAQPCSHRIVPLIAYPLLVLSMAVVLTVACLMFLVPVFDQMFQEYGLQLPATTALVVWASRVLNSYWLLILAGALIVGIAAIVLTMVQVRKDRPVWYGPVSSLLAGRRESLSQWAWHFALLLDLGINESDAISIVGSGCNKLWLRNASSQWAQQCSRSFDPLKYVQQIHGTRCNLLSHAISNALDAEAPEQKSRLLREVAAIYRERQQFNQSVRLAWASPVILCSISLFIGLIVVALFAPLISLISGLA